MISLLTETVQTFETGSTFWQKITGHKALFIYLAVLLASLILLMLLLIIRNAREVRTREAEKKLLKEKRRFNRLCEADARAKSMPKPLPDEDTELSELCERFRNFAASRMGLYYDPEVIRTFISALSVSRLVIMQGISGTGKTSLAYAFGKFVLHEATIVPVQPSWKDRTDMLGYYNEFTGNFTETELLRFDESLYRCSA